MIFQDKSVDEMTPRSRWVLLVLIIVSSMKCDVGNFVLNDRCINLLVIKNWFQSLDQLAIESRSC